MEKYLDQSLSTGTLKNEDLIRAFMPVLKDLAPNQWEVLVDGYPTVLPQVNAGRDTEGIEVEAEYLVEDLFDRLNNLAPEGYRFGNTEGDGADFGFWKEGSDDD